MPSSREPLETGLTPRARTLGAFIEGWRRVLRAPAITAGVLVLTLLTGLPLAIVLRGEMHAHLGSSAAAEEALGGWNREWAAEFSTQSHGLRETFTHEILGFGGTLATLSQLLDAKPITPALGATVGIYIALWIVISGGILDRLARGHTVRAATFFGACGVYGSRLLRLAIPIGACYWVLFAWVHRLLFTVLYNRWTAEMTAESHALALRVALYAVFLICLMLVSLIADFARVRIVVEDRRSVISALGAGTRFIRRRAGRVIGLYLLNILAALILVRLWLQLAPTAASADWYALLASEGYLLFRVWARLGFLASEVVFFQGELAHAQYTAAPEPIWPDSAGVEAIRNLRR